MPSTVNGSLSGTDHGECDVDFEDLVQAVFRHGSSDSRAAAESSHMEPRGIIALKAAGRIISLVVATPSGKLAAGTALLVVIASLLAPTLAPYDPMAQDGLSILLGMSPQHLFGTDGLGRDLFSRLLYGGRISLLVGAASGIVAFGLGTPLGVVAGYWGGVVDYALMRFIDALMAFPPILLALTLAAILGTSISCVVLAVAIAYVPLFAVVARGSVLQQREMEYVQAAIATGVSPWNIVRRHIAPNVLNSVLVQLGLTFPMALLTEASLSFLGLGASPSSPSWGRMLNEGNRFLMIAPHAILVPLVAVCLTTWAFSILGDRMVSVLDPKWRTAGCA